MIAGLAALVLSAQAADFEKERPSNWHHWRGPNGDGVSPDGAPPLEWSGTKNVKWKAAIPGAGSATPVVWKERIFVLTAVPAAGALQRFEVHALDRATGKTLWTKTAVEEAPHEKTHATHGYASASPTTDGEHLIASFGSRGIFCFDLDGNLKWKRDLGDMRIKMEFGEAASPALHRGSVVVNWDHEGDSFIVCLDAKTGEPRWKTPRDEKTTWTTPLVVERDGRAQVVVNGAKRTRSYDLATGALLWECGGQAMNPIAMPVVMDGTVYCMTGYRGNAITAIRLDAKGDVTGGPQLVWKRTDAAPYVASPILYDGLLYLTKERNGILSCLDAKTGEPRYAEQRLPGIDTIYASIVGAAGRVYVTGRSGRTVVLERGPAFKVLAQNDLGEGVDASPVILGKTLLLRAAKNLYCIAE
jgi:outer membrane protein assembly factor BamB